MGPIGHFAVGLMCGIIIMIPFLKDRSLYDYDRQRWVSIEWMPVIKPDMSTGDKKIFTMERTEDSVVTYELNPLTRSKFMMWTPFIAIICGILALLPDISHLWGDSAMDKSRYADLFFFHYTIDMYFGMHGFTVGKSLMFELPLMFTTLSIMLCLMALAQDFQYNRNNYENCVF